MQLVDQACVQYPPKAIGGYVAGRRVIMLASQKKVDYNNHKKTSMKTNKSKIAIPNYTKVFL